MIAINHPARRSVLGDQLRRNAQHHPDAEAFVALNPRRALTYAELNAAANRQANALLARGIGRGDVVALLGTNSIELFTVVWGALKAGAAVTTINPGFTEREREYQIKHSRAKLVIEEALPGDDESEPDIELSDEDLALIPYTSGTTALPKAVMLAHRSYTAATVPAYRAAFGFRPGARFYYIMPLHTMAGLGTQVSLIANGATVVLPNAEPPLSVIVSERITLIAQTPTFYLQLSRMSEFADADLSALERCITYGGTMPRVMVDAFAAASPNMEWTTMWGQSEMAQIGTYGSFRSLDDIPGGDAAWIGRAFPQVELRVVDDDGNDADEGEMLCRTPSLMLGYFDDPERTAATVRDGWLYTNDLVRRSPDGDYFFVDRRHDVIKSGGMNVSSVEVERVLYAHDGVLEAAVVGMADDYWGQVVTAFVVTRGAVTPEVLIAHCKSDLAAYKVPKTVHFVDALPKDAQGKILKRQLRAGILE